jgi:hypothetical protein
MPSQRPDPRAFGILAFRAPAELQVTVVIELPELLSTTATREFS